MPRLVISCSLDPESRSRRLALQARAALEEADQDVDWLDLQEFPLPPCDGSSVYDDARVAATAARVRAATGILVASPVYNYDVNAAAKNLLELTGSAWEGQVVGFLLAAGGQRSYMSVMSFANSLMLDFGCLILPRFVYATSRSFEGDRLIDEKVEVQLRQLTDTLLRVADAVR